MSYDIKKVLADYENKPFPGLELTFRELQGVDLLAQTIIGQLWKSMAKVGAIDDHIAYEKTKLGETEDEAMKAARENRLPYQH